MSSAGAAWNVNVLVGREFRRHHQLYRGASSANWHSFDPAGVGDCFRACVASLVAADEVTDVPHFAAIRNVDEYHAGLELPWHDIRLAREWLRGEGLDLAAVDNVALDELDVPYIVTVQSRLGAWHHAVIARAGAVAFDPSGLNTGRPYTLDDMVAGSGGLALVEPYDPDPAHLIRLWHAEHDLEESIR